MPPPDDLPTRFAKDALGGRYLCHFTTLHLERLSQVVHDNTIYFSPPAEFNDPFELSPFVDMNMLDNADVRDSWLDSYTDLLRTTLAGAAFAQAMPEIEAARGDPDAAKKLFEELPANFVSNLQRKYRVYCLSPEKSVQMWSHYGAKHQGLAFEFNSFGEFFGTALGVNYVETATAIDPTSSGSDVFVHSMLTKHNSWRHENEYRLFASDEQEEGFIHSTDGLVQFPPGELLAIYVGCRMPGACVRAVINEASRRADQVPVRRMVKVAHRLALTSEQLWPEYYPAV
jgi:hypothetical protein